MIEDADTNVLQGLGDLVRGIDVLLAGIALLSGVRCLQIPAGLHVFVQPRLLLSGEGQLWLVCDRYRLGRICPAD